MTNQPSSTLLFEPVLSMDGKTVVGLHASMQSYSETGELPPLAAVLDALASVSGELGTLRTTVPVSAEELSQPEFARRTVAALRSQGLSPSLLAVGIDNRSLVSDSTSAAANVQVLRSAGVTCTLLGFGQGYASLAWLTQFPLDAMELSRVMVEPSDAASTPVLLSTLGMLRQFRIQARAERVDSESQRVWLEKLGVAVGRGKALAAPQEAAGLKDWLRSRVRPGP